MQPVGRKRFPIIYGHRGASKYTPENTIQAFNLAIEQGADGFELDTRLSADGIPVVIHDRSVERTTNGCGNVDQLSAKELEELDAGFWFSKDFQGVSLPLLEDVLKNFKGRALINIELKNSHNPFDKLPERVVELVTRYATHDQILFSSFIPSNLRRIKRLLPDAQVALIYVPGFFAGVRGSKLSLNYSPNFIHPHFFTCDNAYIKKQHMMGRRVNTWTVNEEEDMTALIANGIDGIITNDTQLAVSLKNPL